MQYARRVLPLVLALLLLGSSAALAQDSTPTPMIDVQPAQIDSVYICNNLQVNVHFRVDDDSQVDAFVQPTDLCSGNGTFLSVSGSCGTTVFTAGIMADQQPSSMVKLGVSMACHQSANGSFANNAVPATCKVGNDTYSSFVYENETLVAGINAFSTTFDCPGSDPGTAVAS